MNNLKIHETYIPINVVDSIIATRKGYKTTSLSNSSFSANENSVTFKSINTYFKNMIEKHFSVINNDNQFYLENLKKSSVKVCPKFMINMKKFFNSSSPTIDSAHRKLSNVYPNQKTETNYNSGLCIIFQLHYNKNLNQLYVSGFALCFDNNIYHDYNIRFLNVGRVVNMTKDYIPLTNKNLWWMRNWVLKTSATTKQLENAKKIKLPKEIRQAYANANKKELQRRITVEKNTMNNNITPTIPSVFTKQILSTAPTVSEIYRKIVSSISSGNTIYYDGQELNDVAYATSIKNKHVLVVYTTNNNTPIVINDSDYKKFAIVQKVSLF